MITSENIYFLFHFIFRCAYYAIGGNQMDTNTNFMIIGGDDRFTHMEEYMKEKDYNVKRIFPGDWIADDFNKYNVFILPVPATRDNVNINTPLVSECFYFGDFIRLLPNNATVCGGLLPDIWVEKLKFKGIKVFDYYKNDALKEKNAIPTAEGVIGLLISSLPKTIDGLALIVTGYGKCGKAIAKRLQLLGARVTVCIRDKKHIKELIRNRISYCFVDSLKEHIGSADVIINTVPARLIGKELLDCLSPGGLIIEIASAPFGVDFDYAAQKKINVIKAGSLPGRTAPKTAGKIIFQTINDYLRGDLYDS